MFISKIPTPEMVQHYEQRTKEHIDRVANNMRRLYGYPGLEYSDLVNRGIGHDASKYSPEERLGYIWVTEFHRAKREKEPFEYPTRIEEVVRCATSHHIQSNQHHPEAHESCNKMSLLDLAEMVADWTAMSQELNQNNGSAKVWATENMDKKWKFDKPMKATIFALIDFIDHKCP